MIATPLKTRATACEQFAQPERTAANELPQELSQLPQHYGFPDLHFFQEGGEVAADRGSRRKAGGRKKAALVTKTGKLTVSSTTGFMDDGHPTILAAACGSISPGKNNTRR
jgi:hypothetical protein